MNLKAIQIDEEITLTPIDVSKAEEFLELCIEINSENVMQYTPDIVRNCIDLKSSQDWLEDYLSKFKESAVPDFFIEYNEKIAGIIGYHPFIQTPALGELAFWVAPKYQRKSIAKRSVLGILPFTFKELKLNRIELLIEPENSASLNLAMKCDFQACLDRKPGNKTYKVFYRNS